jgi:hypothetical protein
MLHFAACWTVQPTAVALIPPFPAKLLHHITGKLPVYLFEDIKCANKRRYNNF